MKWFFILTLIRAKTGFYIWFDIRILGCHTLKHDRINNMTQTKNWDL